MKKKGMEMETIAWWLLGAMALILVVVGIFIFKNKGVSALDFVKNLLRMRA